MPVGIDKLKEVQQRLRLRETEGTATLTEKDLKLVYSFTAELVKQFGGFIQAVVLFGSVSRGKEGHDIDLMVVVDDAQFRISPEIIGSYRLGVGKVLTDLNAADILHITTIGLVDFWDGIRHSDPVLFTVIRDCQPITDTGFIKPMKKLLEMGRIRPSKEAIEVHLNRAKALMRGADTHILIAADDLYWACIDSAHAVLMAYDMTPEAPGDVTNVLKKKFKVPIKDANTLDLLYNLMKKIIAKKITKVSPKELEKWMLKTDKFVKDMESLIKKAKKKKSFRVSSLI